MSYSYTECRGDGMRMLQKDGHRFRSNIMQAIDAAGCVRADHAWANISGESWTQMAALDYLCEVQVLRNVTKHGEAGQHQIYVPGPRYNQGAWHA